MSGTILGSGDVIKEPPAETPVSLDGLWVVDIRTTQRGGFKHFEEKFKDEQEARDYLEQFIKELPDEDKHFTQISIGQNVKKSRIVMVKKELTLDKSTAEDLVTQEVKRCSTSMLSESYAYKLAAPIEVEEEQEYFEPNFEPEIIIGTLGSKPATKEVE